MISAESKPITPLRTHSWGDLVRRLFTTADAMARGITPDGLRWGERSGAWRRIERGVYGEGPEPPTLLDRQRARVLVSHAAARGALAGVLHELDSIALDDQPTRGTAVREDRLVVVAGIQCASVLQTLLDLAAILDDDVWEQALECALRRRSISIGAIEAAIAGSRVAGSARIRRVLARRPDGAPPTESLLETLTVQLARTVPSLGEPVRQHEVFLPDGTFVARLDLSWPPIGLFFELDGQHHAGQPVYDARRETAVLAATGWLPGRFTWHEIVHIPRSTARRFDSIADQARRRPFAA